MKKTGPFVLLGTLFIILVFVLGVKYGTRVENTNKAVDFVLSITPTRPPTPTTPVNYQTFKNTGCGVQFLYPSSLKVEKNSSAEASLKQGKAEAVQIFCAKTNPLLSLIKGDKLATEEAKLSSQTLKVRTDPQDPSKKMYFQIINPTNGKQLYVAIDKSLFPLFESTLQYLP